MIHSTSSLVEQNIILYYADFLSLKETSIPVTDNCKYYFIHLLPMNAAYITDSAPFYEQDNYYILKAQETYKTIATKFGPEAALSFVECICNLQALGCINAMQMLKCIHKFSTKSERKRAFKKYEKWKHNQYYTHLIENEELELERAECTSYIAHAEQGTWHEPRVAYDKDNTTQQ